jgi:hypothetical protein
MFRYRPQIGVMFLIADFGRFVVDHGLTGSIGLVKPIKELIEQNREGTSLSLAVIDISARDFTQAFGVGHSASPLAKNGLISSATVVGCLWSRYPDR